MGTSPKQPSSAEGKAPAIRTWSKPVLIEYGHLAKLTRGPSGTKPEGLGNEQTGTSTMMCL
jgi:hypothetical protein